MYLTVGKESNGLPMFEFETLHMIIIFDHYVPSKYWKLAEVPGVARDKK
jgi:hypothetical protein